MILILTGGSEKTQKLILDKLKEFISYELINEDTFIATKSKLTQNLPSDLNFVLPNCFLKSQRYEIYCLAKRFNTKFCILLADGQCDNILFEELNKKFIFENPVFEIDSLNEILELKNVKKKSKAHVKQKIVGSDYLTNIRIIVDRINLDYEKYRFMLKECEEKLMSLVQTDAIDLEKIDFCYKKIINDEIKIKNM
ncbi:hypothetical protein GVAV_000151 [Gurleya vavrai]